MTSAPGAAVGARRRPRARTPIWFLIPAAGLLGGFAVYPLIVLVRMSTSDVGPTNIIGEWSAVGLANFAAAVADDELWAAIGRTFAVAAVLLVSNFVIGFAAASILATGGRITDAVLGLLVFVWALPPLVSGSTWKFLLDDSGPVNTALEALGAEPVSWLASPDLALFTLSAIIAWAALPFSILVIRGGLLAVSPELVEAAALDGAGYWRTQLRIVLPQLRATLGILGILTVLYAFKSFDFFYVTTQGGPGTTTTTLPVLAYRAAFSDFQMSEGATVALISMLVVAVFAVPYVRAVRREEQHA
ncbi:carbohydrate ABC transporter permease [Homoserinibacter sp. YIM 151385]|uniref:carbohydrate ABC transporter permease n=1 Tax=Homoserinibacter sp. YIM 151385 TaxID=2985506 RepID=UPI0022F0ADA8|nr:sugar ABC transporter permease [Homoserinibacter sp. YIM 151385]WBU36964.1 sugar ABC transporter permease [Homoserinibacter sp. YIM 151385]